MKSFCSVRHNSISLLGSVLFHFMSEKTAVLEKKHWSKLAETIKTEKIKSILVFIQASLKLQQ